METKRLKSVSTMSIQDPGGIRGLFTTMSDRFEPIFGRISVWDISF